MEHIRNGRALNAGHALDAGRRPLTAAERREERARARAKLQARFRTVCGVLCFVSFMAMLGFVGNMDQGGPLASNTLGAFISVACFGLFGKLSGAMV